MPRQAQLEPRWLVGLLNAWAQRADAHSRRQSGWYSINPMLKDGIPGKARSYEPTGYSHEDHADTLAAINELAMLQRLAIARYFKPWSKAAIEQEHNLTAERWLKELRAAMIELEKKLRLPIADERNCG